MNVVLAKRETRGVVSDTFATVRDRLPGTGKVTEARQQAFEAYERAGLPHRRLEDWKYTDLRALMRDVLPLAAAPDASALERAKTALASLPALDACRLVLVDGVLAPALSDLAAPEIGVRVQTLREVLEDNANAAAADLLQNGAMSGSMVALNAAMATDGVLVTVADRAVLNKPIHIVHIATRSSASTYTRSFLKFGRAAHATLLESFVAAEGTKSYQVNDAVTLWLGDDAELQHVRLMADSADAANITTAIFTIGAKARLTTFNMTSGGSLSRYQGYLTFAGEGAEVNANGVNLLNGRQHADTTLFLDHAVPNCTSREVFRAVVDDRAHSVFQGRIIVKPDAQKTDAKMMTRALLLSDEAEADNKPELEIFADDVTCGHGATTGALDESLLFYLRARGLSEKEAQALLIQAFVGEAIESIASDMLRELAITTAQRWLEARG
ncbi:MAG TPA: Fe-S cluster assembly protein SufD [Bradyrhizobium sp.]|uniref:Fe-S cluster assembly protein SufD n=1 Tax=Bradyrhizobium sp. TaxID=376 RepID=UPI002D7F5900|nr:Fe-S cluster assembly protein SufD [Bradyrhizobium sp.]HET7889676.1 Fe-S cluster assembly protein SufD [Bradyrhizobium sp.]